MVKTTIYYLYNKETFMGITAIKLGRDRLATILIAIDAVCWGALLVFGIHFFTCGG